ncbi:MAG TPA: vitamin K epoxide reductase family protein [Candidatus Acidoferrum sp.]|nr:vitamin K epoxide reductase family protein [Candidatus Acidoferrum sp.]
MRWQLLALAAGLAGLGVSIYLTAVHYTGVPVACPANGTISCEAVLSSRYGVIAGTSVPTSAAGIVWFAVSALLWTRRPGRVQLVWSVAGLATVLLLVFVEIVLVGAICVWCTAAHVLVLVIFLIALQTANGGRVRS